MAGYRSGVLGTGMRNKRKRKVQEQRNKLAMEKRLKEERNQRNSVDDRYSDDWREYVSDNG
jgi:hypothetical protein